MLCLGITTLIGKRLSMQREMSNDIYALPPLVQIPPEFTQLFFLGFDEIYRDFLNIWLLQAITEEPAAPDSQKMLRLIRQVIRHKPRFESLYMLSCFVMTKIYHNPESCEEITKAGLTVFPESFRIAVTQGFTSGFILNQPAQAAQYYFLASTIPNAPEHIRKIAVKFASLQPMSESDINDSLRSILNEENGSKLRQFLLRHGSKNHSNP